ncbi:unnamed protein product [Leptosia nina]|uniref:Uncharacterized protein n=1 Tax=Leptosia nina TaxID=320188 RepID=A0AAV1J1A8_9NEOP
MHHRSIFLFTCFVLADCRFYDLYLSSMVKPVRNTLLRNPCCVEDPSKNIVRDLKPDDEIVRTFCTNEFNATEVYGFERYKIKYKFKQNIEDTSKLHINTRAIFINLKMENGTEVKDVRIIPKGLRVRDAVFITGADELTLTIPYEADEEIVAPQACTTIRENPMDIDMPSDSRYSAYLLPRYGVDLKNLESIMDDE